MGRIPSLDGLRAISIIAVTLAHSRLGLERLGLPGVDLFFVISGFLITHLLLKELDKSGTISLRGFYWLRSLRILPAYGLFLAGLFVASRLGIATKLTPRDWLLACTYTVNCVPELPPYIGHVWSLSVEEHFYLLWPAAFLAFGQRALWACVVACPMLRIIVAKGDQFDPYLFTPTRIDTIAYGCLLAYFWRTAACRGMLDRMKRRCDLWLIVLVLTLVAASSIESSLYRLTLRFSVCGIIMAAIVALAVDNPECRIGTVLNWRPAVFVGVLSYSLYLWQPLATRPILLACAALGSYFVVERPFLRLKDAGRPLASRTVRM